MSSPILISNFGLVVLVCGVIWSNEVVRKMSKIVNRDRTDSEIIDWNVKNDRASKKVIQAYRTEHENGSLYRELKAAFWLCGIGAAMLVGGPLLRSILV